MNEDSGEQKGWHRIRTKPPSGIATQPQRPSGDGVGALDRSATEDSDVHGELDG
jgi:hypothetical protein